MIVESADYAGYEDVVEGDEYNLQTSGTFAKNSRTIIHKATNVVGSTASFNTITPIIGAPRDRMNRERILIQRTGEPSTFKILEREHSHQRNSDSLSKKAVLSKDARGNRGNNFNGVQGNKQDPYGGIAIPNTHTYDSANELTLNENSMTDLE